MDAQPLERANGDIRFEEVSFGYDTSAPVLSEVSLELRPGERIGVYGVTGAGKTTLISLLTRLYDPNEGGILLDGVDIRDYRVADLRKQFAVVLQEPVLFSTTVAENIAYACPGATFEELVTAAKASALLDGRPTPEMIDLHRMAVPVLRHRIIANYNALGEGIESDTIVKHLLEAAAIKQS